MEIRNHLDVPETSTLLNEGFLFFDDESGNRPPHVPVALSSADPTESSAEHVSHHHSGNHGSSPSFTHPAQNLQWIAKPSTSSQTSRKRRKEEGRYPQERKNRKKQVLADASHLEEDQEEWEMSEEQIEESGFPSRSDDLRYFFNHDDVESIEKEDVMFPQEDEEGEGPIEFPPSLSFDDIYSLLPHLRTSTPNIEVDEATVGTSPSHTSLSSAELLVTRLRPKVVNVIMHAQVSSTDSASTETHRTHSVPVRPSRSTLFDLRYLNCIFRTSDISASSVTEAHSSSQRRIADPTALTIRLHPPPSFLAAHPDADLRGLPVVRFHASGVFFVYGIKTVTEGELAVKLFLRILRLVPPASSPLNSPPPSSLFLQQMKVASIIASFDFGRPLRLDILAYHVCTFGHEGGLLGKGVRFGVAEHTPGSECCRVWLVGFGKQKRDSFVPDFAAEKNEPARASKASSLLGEAAEGVEAQESSTAGAGWAVQCKVHVTGRARFLGAQSEAELAHAFHAMVHIVAKIL